MVTDGRVSPLVIQHVVIFNRFIVIIQPLAAI